MQKKSVFASFSYFTNQPINQPTSMQPSDKWINNYTTVWSVNQKDLHSTKSPWTE